MYSAACCKKPRELVVLSPERAIRASVIRNDGETFCHRSQDEIGKVQVLVRRLWFDPVVDRNCVAARRGGEHRKTNNQSATKVNSIRPVVVASLWIEGEAHTPSLVAAMRWGLHAPRLSIRSIMQTSEPRVRRLVVGGGMVGRSHPVSGETWVIQGWCSCSKASRRASRPGVRAPIVAWKPGNSGGAKGCRKVET